MNWDYLLDNHKSMCFGEKWILWIKECLLTATIAILVNGSPLQEFSMKLGVRQGDPLLPFPFNIIAEGLNVLMQRAVQQGLLQGFHLRDRGTCITHLRFADDTLFFCNPNL